MNREERLKDWYVRYHLIFGKRYTRKQKDRFLKSLSADIMEFRKDLQLDTFKVDKKARSDYRNLYVGNLEKADTIICTYYDTPAARFHPYYFFDMGHRKKSIMTFILLTSILYIIVGFVFTLVVAIPVFQTNRGLSVPYLSCILFYFIYFYFLNKIARGWPKRNNLVQNTASVLLLLDCIASIPSKKVAFAFVDAGCTNHAGLDRLMKQYHAKILMLDSIGSDKPLYLVDPENGHSALVETGNEEHSFFINNKPLVFLISGDEENSRFILTKNDLNKKELNKRNMDTVLNLIHRIVKMN